MYEQGNDDHCGTEQIKHKQWMTKSGMYARQKLVQITQKENDNKIRDTRDERPSYFLGIIHRAVLFINQSAVIVDLAKMVSKMPV
jgi:hypothetical protein